jgi:ABC-type enterochelin transport system substrate-binding protein
MKILLLAFCLTLLLAMLSPQIATSGSIDSQANPEIMGIIKQISATLQFVLIQTAEGEKTISVGPETTIIIDGKEAALQNLKEGQLVKVKLSADTNMAMTIEAS